MTRMFGSVAGDRLKARCAPYVIPVEARWRQPARLPREKHVRSGPRTGRLSGLTGKARASNLFRGRGPAQLPASYCLA